MKIEFNAFYNCLSLKEIHFEKCNEAINTNIYNCNIPDDMKIIIHDKNYNSTLSVEYPANLYRIQKYSDYIYEKINKLENSNIIISIIYLNKIANFNLCENINQIIQQILNYLSDKYLISEKQIQQIVRLMDKKQKVENESENQF